MELKKLLDDYEIGGIGDIKKHTLRFHSYRIGIVEGMLTIFAEYTSGQFPVTYKGYPSGQELLIELCNLNLELRDMFHVTDPVAEGVAIGACSHAVGTSKALEIGPLQGAMSSIALCVCGIITSVLAMFFTV